MESVLKYRGREITTDDVATIASIIESSPKASRRALSLKVCERWSWNQANGTPRDAVCRGLLLLLHRAGRIQLPPPLWRGLGPALRRRPRPAVVIDTSPVETTLKGLGAVTIEQVRRTPREEVVESLIEQHHYLGYARPVGEHLKYLVSAGDRIIGCFCWSSAPRHLGPRDRHIGWSAETRRRNIRFVAYQTRFLIMPWVRVPHLASHLLGRMSRRLSADWQEVYAHPVHFTETFVDPTRYRGTCYRAANWTYLGMTLGLGKDAKSQEPNRSLKQLYGYPLVADFRRRLAGEG